MGSWCEYITENAIKYTINHLLTVAGIDSNKVGYKIIIKSGSAEVFFAGISVSFCISKDLDIDSFLSGLIVPGHTDTADGKHQIPMWQTGDLPFSTVGNRGIVIHADIISVSFILLSRIEEKLISERDNLNRFKFVSSIACKYNFIDFPLVDEYALKIRKDLRRLLSQVELTQRETTIIPTHDIDEVRRYNGLLKTLRTIAGDFLVYKNPAAGFKSIYQAFSCLIHRQEDPYLTSIKQLIDVSVKHSLTSVFFFMTARKSQFNSGYRLTNEVLDIFKIIKSKNMVVGLHGGFGTYRSSTEYAKEKAKLEEYLQDAVEINRQHYLMFDVENTLTVLDSSGILQDSSLGFADREGFRCGTCHPYHPYDISNDKSYNLLERPLIAMDVTLTQYRQLSFPEAVNSLRHLYERCVQVGGDMVLLWHNNSVVREGAAFDQIYCKFLADPTE